MKCEGPGSSMREAGRVPPYARPYKETCCYELSTSKKTKTLYIRTIEYHSGTLELTVSDLEQIIKQLKK